MAYQLGNYVRVSATFKDSTKVLVDPTSVTVFVTNPASEQYAIAATKASTGVYYADILADLPGEWVYRVVASGTVIAAYEGEFAVHSLQSDYLSI